MCSACETGTTVLISMAVYYGTGWQCSW